MIEFRITTNDPMELQQLRTFVESLGLDWSQKRYWDRKLSDFKGGVVLEIEGKDLKAPSTITQKVVNNAELIAYAGLLRGKGMQLHQIADKLNEEGYRTSRNNLFGKSAVHRLVETYKKEQNLLTKKNSIEI